MKVISCTPDVEQLAVGLRPFYLPGKFSQQIQLTPTYKPLVSRQPSSTRTVRQRSGEAEESLTEFYRITDWEMFQEDFGDDKGPHLKRH